MKKIDNLLSEGIIGKDFTNYNPGLEDIAYQGMYCFTKSQRQMLYSNAKYWVLYLIACKSVQLSW